LTANSLSVPRQYPAFLRIFVIDETPNQAAANGPTDASPLLGNIGNLFDAPLSFGCGRYESAAQVDQWPRDIWLGFTHWETPRQTSKGLLSIYYSRPSEYCGRSSVIVSHGERQSTNV
jgi:hypothetical protein